MKILALETEMPDIKKEQVKPFLKEEAEKVWELYQCGVFRELYFRSDKDTAVLIMECKDIFEAEKAINTLPLVREKLVAFDLIPINPYTGFSRLFKKSP